jgi:hypothetical protein
MSKWFTTNELALNLDRTNVIQFITNNSPQYTLNIVYDDKLTEQFVNIKFLGLQISNHLNWKNHIGQMIPKLNTACYAVRSMFHISITAILKSIYFAYFHLIINYGVILGSNLCYSKIIFTGTLQTRIVRIMSHVKITNSYRSLFMTLKILPVPCEYKF